jgi:hypothetical protein
MAQFGAVVVVVVLAVVSAAAVPGPRRVSAVRILAFVSRPRATMAPYRPAVLAALAISVAMEARVATRGKPVPLGFLIRVGILALVLRLVLR